MEKETKIGYDVDLVDRECAMLFLTMAESNLLLRKIEQQMNEARCRMKQEPKMVVGNILRKIGELRPHFDRLFELAVGNGRAEDGTDIVTAFLGDANTFLRFQMMTENALHGDEDRKRELQLESTLKLLAKDPVFDTELIKDICNFK